MSQKVIPPMDPGNPFVSGYPANLTTAKVPTEAGQQLMVTIRSGPATLTLILAKDDAKAWAARLDADASSITGLLLPDGPMILPPTNGQQG